MGCCPASLENQSLPLAVTRLTERPLAFKIGWVSRLCVPARSELLGNSPRARSEWESVFNPASLENHSLPLAVTRLTERPLAFKIGWVSRLCVPARSELLGNSPRARSEWESVFNPASLENHSISLAVTRLTERPLAFKIGWVSRLCVPARSELLGNSPRARSEWESVSVEPHSRITRFPAVARLPVHHWLPNWLGQSVVPKWNSLGIRPARVQNGSQFQSSLIRESLASQQWLGCQFTAGFQIGWASRLFPN
jgi:hypothetical protein